MKPAEQERILPQQQPSHSATHSCQNFFCSFRSSTNRNHFARKLHSTPKQQAHLHSQRLFSVARTRDLRKNRKKQVSLLSPLLQSLEASLSARRNQRKSRGAHTQTLQRNITGTFVKVCKPRTRPTRRLAQRSTSRSQQHYNSHTAKTRQPEGFPVTLLASLVARICRTGHHGTVHTLC